VPVAVYLVAIATMAVLAANVGVPAALAGAALFVVSDTVLALNRFVRPLRQATWSSTSPTTWPRAPRPVAARLSRGRSARRAASPRPRQSNDGAASRVRFSS